MKLTALGFQNNRSRVGLAGVLVSSRYAQGREKVTTYLMRKMGG